MKKIYTKFTLVFMIMLAGNILSAQKVIIEHSNRVPDSSRKVQSEFDIQNYTPVVEKNGLKMYLESQDLEQDISASPNENVYLHINLSFDLSTYFPFVAKVYNESGYENTSYFIGENPMTFEVPPGNYDVFFLFYNMNSQQALMVIKEEQEINQETTLTFNPEEAS